jgi:secondary thiamine-phosphate synthase enzyme
MQVQHHIIKLSTNGKGTYPIEEKVRSILNASSISQGVATLFVQHTSCSLVIMENADPDARTDLHEYFNRLVPENEPYFIHTYEGPDDMPSHIRMVLTGCSEMVPIVDASWHSELGKACFYSSIEMLLMSVV